MSVVEWTGTLGSVGPVGQWDRWGQYGRIPNQLSVIHRMYQQKLSTKQKGMNVEDGAGGASGEQRVRTWKPDGSGSCRTVSCSAAPGCSSSCTASRCVAPASSVPFTLMSRSPMRSLPERAATPPGTIWLYYRIQFNLDSIFLYN